MSDREPTAVANLDRYGNPAIPWNRAREQLIHGTRGPNNPYFLGTVRPDGRPHAAGVGAIWHDGDLYLTSSPAARKARNLAANPACTIATHLVDLDVTLEGEARRVTDPAVLATIAALYREIGWPAEVSGDALTAPYSAPSAGAPPWQVYRFTFHSAVGVSTVEPGGATRWRFDR